MILSTWAQPLFTDLAHRDTIQALISFSICRTGARYAVEITHPPLQLRYRYRLTIDGVAQARRMVLHLF